MKRVVVIGGGAAGLMAAKAAADGGNDVTVVEKNSRPARKMMITGKGRCNITNDADIKELVGAVTGNGRFLYSSFNMFSSADTMRFFEENGVPLKVERGGRVFPCSDRAVDIVDALVGAAVKSGAKIICDRVTGIDIKEGAVKGVKTENNLRLPADAVIVATGGMSYPATGSTGDGYELAKKAGHNVTPIRPSLVPLTVLEGWCSSLQGLSLKNVTVSLYAEGEKKPLYSELGEMMFTHFGLTGPEILSASAYIDDPKTRKYYITIDMKPALSAEKLDQRIMRDFAKYSNRDYINSLCDLLPKKMVPVVVGLSHIEPSQKVNQITREQRERIVSTLKCLTLHITGTRPIDEAIVTKGGVELTGVDPKTMQSKTVNGLYFAGEVLDVDAFTGGYNLQIAFSTGFSAGSAIK